MESSVLKSNWGRVFLVVSVGGALVTPSRAELISLRITELETWYGGFEGPNYRETAFDFGLEFTAVDQAWVHVAGTPSHPQFTNDVCYQAYLDGEEQWGDCVILPPWQDLVVDIPLWPGPGVLDGEGTVGLLFYVDVDNTITVTEATLWFDATPVPEPAGLALLGMGALALRRHWR